MNIEALKNLGQFNGGEKRYRTSLFMRSMIHTEGVQFLANNADCFWLLDAIVSHQPQVKRVGGQKLQEFQLWQLKVDTAKRTAVLTCKADSDCEPIVSQKIPYTDFPLSEIKLYVMPTDSESGLKWVILLPSEY